ncbi:MAG: DUF4301 family protein [Bacteroidales bacterium]|nr:DUF4301 family protein [Bacteroidales bacterium]
MFKDKDLKQLKEHGISIKQAEEQLSFLRQGLLYARIAKNAAIGKGIRKLNNKMVQEYVNRYEQTAASRHIIKFVPASGAATRMFRALHEADSLCRQPDFNPKLFQNDAYQHVAECFNRLEDFAFYPELEKVMKKNGSSLESALNNRHYHLILNFLLEPEGLNYGSLPKGLIAFHRYENGARTAFEEHMVEGAGYAATSGNHVSIHLTVSPENEKQFRDLLQNRRKKYENRYNVHYDISFSVQKPSTDTLSLDENNMPFREPNGKLHLRPGGHGALLENLNELDADLIFIKNIDNVAPDRNKNDTITYKKALAGILFEYQEKIFSYLSLLEKTDHIADEMINEISSYLRDKLGTSKNLSTFNGKEEAVRYLQKKLNRPIRVCGMVKNIGEPGGGPFWVAETGGINSLQIIESSQVNHRNPEQEAMFSSSSHFNPVDLVCGVKDYRGNKFDLLKHRDPNTCFISKKYRNGKPLKAFEWPGLWNGSMADWNTVFVEVPVSTFSPVKTLHDLLRPEHQ